MENQEFPLVNLSNPPTIKLRIFSRFTHLALGVFLIVSLIYCIYLAQKTNILRDSVPLNQIDYNQQEDSKLPFSLGRIQMAFWFFLIFQSFIYIGIITWNYRDIITESSLTLMGISAITGVSSIFIDNDKYPEKASQLQKFKQEKEVLQNKIKGLKSKKTDPEESKSLEEAKELQDEYKAQIIDKDQKIKSIEKKLHPKSKNIFSDILCDTNGISFYRFQIVIWTLTLGIIFVVQVYQNLTMPEFDATLLTLQGITSGTYLGFKLPTQGAK